MKLRDFCSLLTPEQRTRYATLAGTTPDHLFQLTGGWRRPSSRLAWRLSMASRVIYPRCKAKWLRIEEILADAERIYRGPGSDAAPKRRKRKSAA